MLWQQGQGCSPCRCAAVSANAGRGPSPLFSLGCSAWYAIRIRIGGGGTVHPPSPRRPRVRRNLSHGSQHAERHVVEQSGSTRRLHALSLRLRQHHPPAQLRRLGGELTSTPHPAQPTPQHCQLRRVARRGAGDAGPALRHRPEDVARGHHRHRHPLQPCRVLPSGYRRPQLRAGAGCGTAHQAAVRHCCASCPCAEAVLRLPRVLGGGQGGGRALPGRRHRLRRIPLLHQRHVAQQRLARNINAWNPKSWQRHGCQSS